MNVQMSLKFIWEENLIIKCLIELLKSVLLLYQIGTINRQTLDIKGIVIVPNWYNRTFNYVPNWTIITVI